MLENEATQRSIIKKRLGKNNTELLSFDKHIESSHTDGCALVLTAVLRSAPPCQLYYDPISQGETNKSEG